MRLVRKIHSYLGIFLAPSILFFALTGAVQAFNLHESREGRSFEPPMWLMRLAQVHKNQTLEIRKRPRPPQPANATTPEPAAPAPPAAPPPARKSPLPMKWFVEIVAIGLATTTVLGLVLAFRTIRDRRVVWGLLILGTAVPVVLLLV